MTRSGTYLRLSFCRLVAKWCSPSVVVFATLVFYELLMGRKSFTVSHHVSSVDVSVAVSKSMM